MEKRWAAQISLQDFKHALPPPRGVKGLDRAEVMDRRPLTDTRRSYKDMYGPVPTHTRQTNRGESFSAPADRTSRKAPALSSQKGVSAEPRTWRLALEGEANSDNEDWKDFDIDIQDSPTRYVSYTPSKVLARTDRPLTQYRQPLTRKRRSGSRAFSSHPDSSPTARTLNGRWLLHHPIRQAQSHGDIPMLLPSRQKQKMHGPKNIRRQ